MEKIIKVAIGVFLLFLTLCAGSAFGISYLAQWDDMAEGPLHIVSYADGVLIEDYEGDIEGYEGFYGLDPGVLLNDIDIKMNIYEDPAYTELSDTFHIIGYTGDMWVWTSFHSDGWPGGVVELDGGIPMVETGDWQTVGSIETSVGDLFTFQFRSDTEPPPVPEPVTMLLIGSGLVFLTGLRRRSRKK